MTVFVVTVSDQAFDKKSAEVAYIARVLDTIRNELVRGQGTVTSGSVIGVSPAGVANTSLGSWTYTPSATKP